eukprot:gene21409-27439_t
MRTHSNKVMQTSENSSFNRDLELSRASPLKTTTSLPNFLKSAPLLAPTTSSSKRFDSLFTDGHNHSSSHSSDNTRFRFEPSNNEQLNSEQQHTNSDILPTPNKFDHSHNQSLLLSPSVTILPRRGGPIQANSPSSFSAHYSHRDNNDYDGGDSDDQFMSSINNFQEEIDKINRSLGVAVATTTSDVYGGGGVDYQAQYDSQQQPGNSSAHRLTRSEFSD